MKRQHDALRLDVAAFAADGAALSGRWPGEALSRLADSQSPPQDMALPEVDWAVQGERRAVTGGEAELWLSLQVQATVWLTCQRCLQPFQVPLALDRRLQISREKGASLFISIHADTVAAEERAQIAVRVWSFRQMSQAPAQRAHRLGEAPPAGIGRRPFFLCAA